MARKVVHSDDAPKAIGPYSQAIVANGFVFTAGQIALDPKTGQVITGDVRAQTERVVANLTAVLAAAGASWRHVVKTTVFLADIDDFAAVNAVYANSELVAVVSSYNKIQQLVSTCIDLSEVKKALDRATKGDNCNSQIDPGIEKSTFPR